MKYSNLTAFEKHLEGAAPSHFADIYLIMAKEPFVRKQATDYLTKLVLKNEENPQLSMHVFDAEKHGADQVLRELKTMSFFAKKRLIIVQNADSFDKASTLKFEKYCESPNRFTCFVIVTASLNRVTTFYKKLEKAGVVLDVPEEKPWEREKSVADWLIKESIKQKTEMNPQVAHILIKQVGTDQMLLSSELAKLICYVGDRKAISEKDVETLCCVANLENGWQLGEAIFRRDATAALRISKGLLLDGVALIALLRQIRSQFQTEYQVCSILNRGGTPVDVSKEFPYMKGIILERHVRQSQTYGMQRFKSGLLAIDEAEIQAKNSAMDAEFLAERLIIQLTVL
jgi:DNA polymerase-3 subunit delta